MALRDIMIYKKNGTDNLLFYSCPEDISNIALSASVKRLSNLERAVSAAIDDLSKNINVQTVLTLLITNNQ